MLFNSMVFLWFFFPITFCIHFVLPNRIRNIFLLMASLIFYSWGEPIFIILMLTSILLNYFVTIVMDKTSGKLRRCFLVFDIVLNIGLLWYFKYYHDFIDILNNFMKREVLSPRDIVLPLGISFYTFQILSYVIDVYKRECDAQYNLIDFALYVSLFPQLVAGPIVKYKDIEMQLKNRIISYENITRGLKRFIYGLSKKVLLANSIAKVADLILSRPYDMIATKWLWVGVCLYTLQIYYDFSGYSDMAIGLGSMLGFSFPENFNYPYVASSITDFWRRWHMSLSTWFKEYIYIPMGGNRKGKIRTYVNLAVVFLLTGIWHGSTLNFLLWGCFHGFFIVIERILYGKLFCNFKCKVIPHLYTMFVVTVGWGIFRCNSLKDAAKLIYHMFYLNLNHTYVWYDFFSIRDIIIVFAAIMLVGFIQDKFKRIKVHFIEDYSIFNIEWFVQIILLILCMIMLIGGQYNPFIYFRF